MNKTPFLPKVHKMLRRMYPSMPVIDMGQLVTKISVRVIEDPLMFETRTHELCHAMTTAHVRHTRTFYDELLAHLSKEEARLLVVERIKNVLTEWRRR